MKVALVSLPWNRHDKPSMALAVLAAYLRQHEPAIEVRCLHEQIKVWARLQHWYEAISDLPHLGELFYAALLYPGRRSEIGTALGRLVDNRTAADTLYGRAVGTGRPALHAVTEHFDEIVETLSLHLQELAEDLAGRYEVVGMTSVFSQLLANISLCRRIKQLSPIVKTVLGGTGCMFNGKAIIAGFPEVDYVVRGEGELRLLTLLRGVRDGKCVSLPHDGVLAQARRADLEDLDESSVMAISSLDLVSLDGLPWPDFSEYHELAELHKVPWRLPVQGSRGCARDRVRRTGRPGRRCSFCSDTDDAVHRVKSDDRLVVEIEAQVRHYQPLAVEFADEMLCHTDGTELCTRLRRLDCQIPFFAEVRASLRPEELLALKEAGCVSVQIGIEGLSTLYLRRLNKGTTTIQNLQAMKSCFELGIHSASNLLIRFPGASQEEVDETRRNIIDYAIAYEPLNISCFDLQPGSPVFRSPERFGILAVRPARELARVLPGDLGEQLALGRYEYTTDGPQADWSGVVEACRQWRELHARLQGGRYRHPLHYVDGGTYLKIVDERRELRIITLEGLWRSLYLACMEIRSLVQLVKEHRHCTDAETAIPELLAAMVKERLVFREGNRYLSLAAAPRTEQAAQRVRMQSRARNPKSKSGVG